MASDTFKRSSIRIDLDVHTSPSSYHGDDGDGDGDDDDNRSSTFSIQNLCKVTKVGIGVGVLAWYVICSFVILMTGCFGLPPL